MSKNWIILCRLHKRCRLWAEVAHLSVSGPFLAMIIFSLPSPPTGALSVPVVNCRKRRFCSSPNECNVSQNSLQCTHTDPTVRICAYVLTFQIHSIQRNWWLKIHLIHKHTFDCSYTIFTIIHISPGQSSLPSNHIHYLWVHTVLAQTLIHSHTDTFSYLMIRESLLYPPSYSVVSSSARKSRFCRMQESQNMDGN